MKIFSDIALGQVPRILGFMDRDPRSATYGCCDRAFWHYKTMDFSNARFQEAALVLALVFAAEVPGNRFYRSQALHSWAMAAMAFWVKRAHRDGSVDESYPFERHFCATAFGLYALTESLLLLQEKLPWDLTRAGNFLVRHNNPDVANQMACAAQALHNLFLLTGEQKFQAGSEQKIAQLLSMQAKDGAFCEYGGFDLGYDSITLGFLASLFKKTMREDLKRAALRLIEHAAPHIQDDGYFSPQEMSRQTQFLYPYGFSVFDKSILEKIAKGLQENVLLNPAWLDDRYCVPLTANYMQTACDEVRR